jgi:hypothetical protein
MLERQLGCDGNEDAAHRHGDFRACGGVLSHSLIVGAEALAGFAIRQTLSASVDRVPAASA